MDFEKLDKIDNPFTNPVTTKSIPISEFDGSNLDFGEEEGVKEEYLEDGEFVEEDVNEGVSDRVSDSEEDLEKLTAKELLTEVVENLKTLVKLFDKLEIDEEDEEENDKTKEKDDKDSNIEDTKDEEKDTEGSEKEEETEVGDDVSEKKSSIEVESVKSEEVPKEKKIAVLSDLCLSFLQFAKTYITNLKKDATVDYEFIKSTFNYNLTTEDLNKELSKTASPHSLSLDYAMLKQNKILFVDLLSDSFIKKNASVSDTIGTIDKFYNLTGDGLMDLVREKEFINASVEEITKFSTKVAETIINKK